MKKILILIYLSSKAFGLEIQCQTKFPDLSAVIKTSESTQKTYLLFLNETELEKYWQLEDGFFVMSPEGFEYSDGETTLKVDLDTHNGSLKSPTPLIRGESELELSVCASFEELE